MVCYRTVAVMTNLLLYKIMFYSSDDVCVHVSLGYELENAQSWGGGGGDDIPAQLIQCISLKFEMLRKH